jgi:hypothetical protein
VCWGDSDPMSHVHVEISHACPNDPGASHNPPLTMQSITKSDVVAVVKGSFASERSSACTPAELEEATDPATSGEGPSFDAGPSIALTEGNTVAINHTTRSGDNRTYVSPASTPDYDGITTGITGTGWATGGSSDVANDPSQEDTVWVAALKATTSAHAKLYVYEVENGEDIQRAKLAVGDDDDQWSLEAAPSIVVDGEGNVYVVAVQADGDFYVFKINPASSPPYAFAYNKLGGNGWSETGTVSLAWSSSDDAIWLTAATNDTYNEIRTFRNTPHALSFTSYGTVGCCAGWTVEAAPGIVVDNDGDVTIVAVKAATDGTGVMWSNHNVDGVEDNWVKINDDEAPQDSWRLQPLRGWSNAQSPEVPRRAA